MERKDIVTSALDSFLKIHLPHSSIGAIDDIVLNYLVGILEDVGNEDGFDVEDFAEMMEAYIPGFGDITSAVICEWIFQLSRNVLSSACKKETPPTSPPSVKERSRPKEASPHLGDIELPYTLPSLKSSDRQQENGRCDIRRGQKAETRFQKSNSSMLSPRNIDDKIKLLTEMFPDSCKVKVKRCLSDSNGDIEQAVQAMLHHEEQKTGVGSCKTSNKSDAATAIAESNIQLLCEMFPGCSELQARQCLSIAEGDPYQASQVLLNLQESGKIEDQGNTASFIPIQRSSARDETHVKESLLEKYGYIDTDDDKKSHRPMEPKKEKKKMVRYINSQTVTTKGERFVESKKPESEEMKKTYTNLKPARRYHFH